MTDRQIVKQESSLRVLDVLEDEPTGRPYARATIISAGMSLNGTLYPADVLAAGAHKYSKSKMMLDHPDFWNGDYSVRDLAGIYGQAEWDRSVQGVVAPLYFLTATEAGRLALNLAREEAALRREGVLGPSDKVFGLSHVAYVDVVFRKEGEEGHDPAYSAGYYEATNIADVLSGDMVVFDAAGGKIQKVFESAMSQMARGNAREPVTSASQSREGVVRRENANRGTRKVTVRVNP